VNLSKLIDGLTLPETYPHPVEVITTIETHISVIFLTGSYAYKLKKPVNFGFLDFSTLALRKRYCELEITLNQRTAPNLYLKTLPLYYDGASFSFKPIGELVDYLNQMVQFNPNAVLGRILSNETLPQSQIHQLASDIAHFHLNAQTIQENEDKTLPWGHPDNLLHPMLDNFPTLLKTFGHPDDQYRLNQLAQWTRFTQKSLFRFLEDRRRNGFVRACHGDIHLDNIALLDGVATLFDGIEFNEQFRWIDVINDLAFLLVDLENRQQFLLKRQLLNQYLKVTGDYEGLACLVFYQVYRAMVRAKISALRAHQLEDHPEQATQTLAIARHYINQAEETAYHVETPKLILMQGVAGSGKSTYAQQLLQYQNAIILSSDIERKRLYGIAPLDRLNEVEKRQLYSPEMSRRTYQRLLALSETLLSLGYSVIVDATFLKEAHRKPFQDIANKHNYGFKIFCIDATLNLAQIKHNLQLRQQSNQDPSDATIEVMESQCQQFEPPSPANCVLTVSPMQRIDENQIKIWLEMPLC